MRWRGPRSVPIYLDYHATTPVDPRVLAAMTPYFMEVFGNPASTSHRFGLQARAAVEQARQRIATALNAASPSEIVFTSGSTESNNLAIKGVVRTCGARGRHVVTAATEHRPGTYIYMDRFQVAKGVGGFQDCALTVLATVVSRPTENRAIIDAGSKALTSDTLGMTGFGLIEAYPGAEITGLSEEHGTVDLSNCSARPAIGDKLRIIPNHACVVSNLFDTVTLISGDSVVETVWVDARGRVD